MRDERATSEDESAVDGDEPEGPSESDTVVMIELVGEAPVIGATERHQWLHPSFCSSGRRLVDFAGWTLAELEGRTVRRNVYPRPLGTSPLRAWRAPVARRLAALEAASIPLGARVVLLGQRVAEAFGFPGTDLLEWAFPVHGLLQGRHVAVVPHPSGRNRWWNDHGNRMAARAFLRAAMA